MKRFTIIILAVLLGCSDDPKPSVDENFKVTFDDFIADANANGYKIDGSKISVKYKSYPDDRTNDTQFINNTFLVDKEFFSGSWLIYSQTSQRVIMYQTYAHYLINKPWDCYGIMRRISDYNQFSICSPYIELLAGSMNSELFHDDKSVYNQMKTDFETNSIPCNN